MSGEHLLAGYQPPSQSAARVGEPLWTLTRDGQRIDAELLDQGSAGWELRMLQNHEWISGRRFSERADAVAHAEQHRQQLTARGWLAA